MIVTIAPHIHLTTAHTGTVSHDVPIQFDRSRKPEIKNIVYNNRFQSCSIIMNKKSAVLAYYVLYRPHIKI